MNEQHFAVNIGSTVAIQTQGLTIHKHCGVAMGGFPKVGKDGRIRMEFAMTLTEPKVAVPTSEDDFSVVNLDSTLGLANGETGYLGGVTRRVMQSEMTKIPLIGDLPVIGSWFHFRRQMEVEQELFVAVTAKVLHDPTAPLIAPPASLPAPPETRVLALPKR
jgi:Flp pilus assembly secretin CpaC